MSWQPEGVDWLNADHPEFSRHGPATRVKRNRTRKACRRSTGKFRRSRADQWQQHSASATGRRAGSAASLRPFGRANPGSSRPGSPERAARASVSADADQSATDRVFGRFIEPIRPPGRRRETGRDPIQPPRRRGQQQLDSDQKSGPPDRAGRRGGGPPRLTARNRFETRDRHRDGRGTQHELRGRSPRSWLGLGRTVRAAAGQARAVLPALALVLGLFGRTRSQGGSRARLHSPTDDHAEQERRLREPSRQSPERPGIKQAGVHDVLSIISGEAVDRVIIVQPRPARCQGGTSQVLRNNQSMPIRRSEY